MTNIRKKGNSYQVRIQRNGLFFNRTFKRLKDAKEYKNKILN